MLCCRLHQPAAPLQCLAETALPSPSLSLPPCFPLGNPWHDSCCSWSSHQWNCPITETRADNIFFSRKLKNVFYWSMLRECFKYRNIYKFEKLQVNFETHHTTCSVSVWMFEVCWATDRSLSISVKMTDRICEFLAVSGDWLACSSWWALVRFARLQLFQDLLHRW